MKNLHTSIIIIYFFTMMIMAEQDFFMQKRDYLQILLISLQFFKT